MRLIRFPLNWMIKFAAYFQCHMFYVCVHLLMFSLGDGVGSIIWSFFNSCSRTKETSLKFKKKHKILLSFTLFLSLAISLTFFFSLNDQKLKTKTKKLEQKKILCNDILKSKQTNEMIQKEKEQRSLAKLIKYRWKCATNCGNRFKIFNFSWGDWNDEASQQFQLEV